MGPSTNSLPCLNLLTKKAPYKGLGASNSEEKHEPASDIETAVVDGLNALAPKAD